MIQQNTKLLNDGWIIGFIEGEGCFTIAGKWNNTTKNGVKVPYRCITPAFLVAQKDPLILERVREFFNQFEVRGRVWPKTKNKDNFEYRVLGFKNCYKLIMFFENRLESNYKAAQFQKWKGRIFEHMNQSKQLSRFLEEMK